MMVANGAFSQTGELNVIQKNLPEVYDNFFGEVLDMFLSYSARTVISVF